jgi:hypothetical protein
MAPELGIELLHLHTLLFLQPGRHHQPVTELTGLLPTKNHKIITTQVYKHLPGIQLLQDLSPVEFDESLRIGNFYQSPRGARGLYTRPFQPLGRPRDMATA